MCVHSVCVRDIQGVCACAGFPLLSEKSQMFSDASNKLKQDLWWQAVKLRIAIAGGIAVRLSSLHVLSCA